MAQLQHLIENPTEVWAAKDALKPGLRFELLSEDPLAMHKSKFLDYLRAKAEAVYRLEARNRTHEEAVALVAAETTKLVADWKTAARIKATGR